MRLFSFIPLLISLPASSSPPSPPIFLSSAFSPNLLCDFLFSRIFGCFSSYFLGFSTTFLRLFHVPTNCRSHLKSEPPSSFPFPSSHPLLHSVFHFSAKAVFSSPFVPSVLFPASCCKNVINLPRTAFVSSALPPTFIHSSSHFCSRRFESFQSQINQISWSVSVVCGRQE